MLRIEALEARRLLSLTADTLTGGILTINFNAADTVAITNLGGKVLVNGANPTTGAASASSVTAINITGTGSYNNTVDLSGVSTATGFSVSTVAIATGGAASFDTVLLGALNASGAVTVSGTGSIHATLAANLAAGSLAITPGSNSTITIDGNITTSGVQSFGAPVTLAGNSVLSAGSGNVTFGSTLNGNDALTVNTAGITTFTGNVGALTALSALTTDASGTTVVDASITTSGALGMTLNDPITLGGNATLAAGTQSITLGSTVDGAHSLTVNAWHVNLEGAIGSSTPLTSFTLTAPLAHTFSGGSINTTGAQNIDSGLTLAADATFSAGSSNIFIQSGIQGAFNAQFNTTGTITFWIGLGNQTPLASVTTSAGASTYIDGDITTTGDQTYNGPALINGSTALNAGSGNITFNSSVDNGRLTATTSGTTTFNGPVGTKTTMTNLTIGAGGTTVINGGAVKILGLATFDNSVVLQSSTTFTDTQTQFYGTIDGPGALTVGQNTTVFAGAVGATAALPSLTVNGQTVLAGDTSFNVGAGGISLSGVSGSYALSMTTIGSTTVGGAISTPTSLSILATGPITLGGSVTTSGNQVYSHPASLATNASLTSTGGTISYISSAPILNPISPMFAPVSTNLPASTPESVATLVGRSILDGNQSYSIAVTDQSTPGGDWQYSLDGATWANFGVVSGTQSLLLAATDLVQFAPDGVDTGTATFTYRAWNLGTGTPGTLADTTSNGGNTAFSTASDMAAIVIQIPPVVTTDTFSGGVLTVNVDGSQNVTISSSGGNVQINGADPTSGPALAGAVTAINITATAGPYNNVIDLTGVSAAAGFTSLATLAINTGKAYSGDQVKLGTLNASGLLSITGSGTDAVTTPASLVAGSLNIAATSVSLNSVTTTGNQIYNAAVTLASDATLSSGSGNVTFNGTVNGYLRSLTVDSSGVTTFGVSVGGSGVLASLTTDAAGSTVVDASLTTASALTINDPLTLGASVTLGNGSSNTVSINNTVDGAHALTINTGTFVLGGAIGSQTPLTALTVESTTTSTLGGGSIVTTGAQYFYTDQTLAADTTFNAGSAAIHVGGLDGAYNATLHSSGTTTVLGNFGGVTPLASLTTDAVGTIAFDANVTTSGNQTYNNAATVAFATTLQSSGGNITFNSTINGNYALTAVAAGTTTFNGALGKTNALASLTIGAGGTTVLAGSSINTTSTITFNSPVVLGSDMSIADNGGAAIVFNSTVDGDFNLSMGKSGSPGTTFAASVGGSIPLASLSSGGATLSLANVTTVGSQTYTDTTVVLDGTDTATSGSFTINNSATLAGNTVISAGGSVSLNQVNGAYGLNIVSGGVTTFNGWIGPFNPPTSLTVDAAGGENINSIVDTSGNQIYLLPTTLGGGALLSSASGTVSKVSSINTAPILTPVAPAMPQVVMNQTGAPMTVAAIAGNSITDNNGAHGIAVTGQSATEGSWQYSLDGVVWINFPAASATQGLLLAANDEVRFLPDGVHIGPATFSYAAWNQTSGTAGTLADTTVNGGNTAFSTASDTASIFVQMISSITTETFSGGVLTVNIDGPQSVTITSSGGNVLINGANPTTGAALASAVTAINITATSGAYDNVIDLSGVSASAGFTALATVAVDTGGSYSADQVKLGTLNASGLVSVTGAGSDTVTIPSGLTAGSVSIAATAISLNSVTTTGNQTYSGPVTLAANTIVSSGSGNVTFSGTLNGGYNLTVDSSGVTTFGAVVGGNAAPSSLTTDAGGSTVFDGSVTSSGNITIGDSLTLGANVTLSAGTNLVTLGGTVDGAYALVLNTWKVSLGGAIGSITPLASLTENVTFNNTFSGGSITTTGPQTYTSDLVLGSDATFKAGSATINIGNLDGAYNVTFDTSGTTELGNLGGSTPLASVTTDAGGTTDLNGDVTTSGSQAYNDPVLLAAFTAIDAGSGNVTFGSTVDGGGLTVNTTGTTTFEGAVGNTAVLNGFTISAGGTTVLAGGSINTTFSITFGSPVVLGSDMAIGNVGFSINFNGTVDGDFNLSMGTSGLPGTTFAAPVGGVAPLASLTSAGATLSIGNVTTIGAQTFNDQAVQLDGVEKTTSGAISVAGSATLLGNSVINAGGAVNLNKVDGAFGLNIVSGAVTTLGGQIGSKHPLASLSVSSTGGEAINANVTTSGNQFYSLPTTVAGGVTLTSTAGTVSKVGSVGTAPVLTPFAPAFAPVEASQASSPPTTIAALVGSSITDNNGSYNIAVTAATSSAGTWQYSLDGVNWVNFPAVSGSQSLLLAAADQVQFIPDGLHTGSDTFTYRAWDLSSGTAGTLVSTTSNGGNTAFSAAADTASIVIQVAQSITTDTLAGGVLTVNVDGSQNVTISSSGGNVLVNGFAPATGTALASSVTAIDITATSGAYDNVIDLSGVSAAAGFTSLATVTIDAGGSYSSDQVKLGPLGASGLVSITGSGDDAVTASASLVAGSVSITATAISLISVTTTGDQTYNGPVTLAGDATLSAGSGNISFNGTVDGRHTLTVDSSGVTTFGGTVGGSVTLGSLTTDAGGSTVLDASVTTSGNLNINDPLTLGADVTLGAGTSTVNINNTIDGAYALTIDTWNVSLGGAIGSITPLVSISESVPFSSTFSGGSITTTGAQTFDTDVKLGSDATFNAGSAEISINNLDGAYHATFDTSGLTNLGDLGSSTPLAGVTTDAAGTTYIGGDVTTTGNQVYSDPVSLWAFTTINAGSGNVTFNSTVDGGGLTLNTTGTATFNGAVGSTSSLGSITIGAGGTTVLAGGSISTTFGMTFNSPIVLGSDMSIANVGFSIVFGGTVDGDYNLSVGRSGFPGTTFAAAVGGATPLASLTSAGGTLSLQSVTTVGSQTYSDGAVQLDGIERATAGAISISNSATLLGNTVLSASGAVSINQVDGHFALNIVSGAPTMLNGKIGQTTPPASLTVDSAGGESIFGNVTTSGNQIYTLPVTVASGVKLSSTAGTVSEIPSVSKAPVLTPSAPSLAPVVTNQTAGTPISVAALVGNSIADENRSYNIAVSGQSTPGGTWQYSLDGLNWTNFGAVSATQSLLLAASDEVRFAPDGVSIGTATFSYRAWSMATGTAGTLADTTANGGNTAFSIATDMASILIQTPAVVTTDTFSGGVLTVNVDGGQNVTITSSGGNLLVNGSNPASGAALASAVTAINITATAGAYDNVIDLSGVSASAGFSSLATVTVNTGGAFYGDQVKLGTLNASGLVWISGSGSDAVTAPGNLAAGILSIAAATISLNSVTTTGNQIYNGAVTIASNATIAAGSGNVTFNGTLDGAHTLAVNSSGVTTFGGTVGGVAAPQSLTTDAAGSTVIDASVNTNGSLNINDPLRLGGNVTLGSGINTVNINNTIDGAYALTINTWNMALKGAIGSTTPLASFTENVPFNSTFSGGSITTTGAQNYSGLTLGADTTFAAGSAAINIGGLNGAYHVTLDSSGVTTLSGNIGGSMALASLTADAGGTTDLTGNVTTSGNQTYDSPVLLGAFSTLNAGSANITFNSTVDNGGLTVNTTGITTFNAAVGAAGALGGITIGAGGTTVLAGGSIRTTFGMTFNSPIVLGSDMSVSSAGFAIDFNSTVDGDFNLSVGQSGFPGTTFAAAVGGLTPLASLTSAGGTLSLHNVTTVGSQTYNDGGVQLDGLDRAVNGSFTVAHYTALLGNTVINAGGAVGLNQVNGKYGLIVVSGAVTTLGGSIGAVSPPVSVMVSSAGGELINANVITSGDQAYTLPVTLALGVTLTSTGGTVSEIAALGTAPVLTPIAPVIPPVLTNQPSSAPTTVTALVGSSITDNSLSYNIAVTAQSTPGGVWQYSLDDVTWANLGTVSGTHSLLLAAGDLVRFAPDGVDTGSATFTYRAWNMASGTAGTYVDTTANGGNTAFSTATDTASITVQVAQSIITDTFSAGVLTVSVAGSQNVTISSSGGDVLVNGSSPSTGTALASAVTAINITAPAGAYDNVIDLTGVSASTGFSALATLTVNTGGSYSSDQVKLGTLNASGLVSITGSGVDAVTATTSLAAGSLSITATTIRLTSVTTTGSQTFNGAVTLAGNATISAGSGNVSFNGTLDGGYNLAVDSSGVTTFGGTVGGSIALSTLVTDAAGKTVLDASVTTGGGLTINDPLTLGGNVTLGAGVNTVSINNTIDGAYALTINTWDMALNGAIGSTTPLASLAVSVPFTSTFAGQSITTSGAQTYNTNLTLGSDTTFNAGSSAINIDGLNGAYHVTFDSSGLTTLSGNLGSSIALASVTTDAGGTTYLNGNVTTSGSQTYNDPVSLWAFATLNGGSGNITFNSTVDSGGLTVNTTGTTTFNGAVGEAAVLGSFSIGAGGTTDLAGGSINTTFGITFGSPVVLGSDMVIANAGFAIEFNGTVDGDYNLSVGQSGFPGTTFAAAVGGLTPLASLTSAGGTLSLGNVTTIGAQTYHDGGVQLDGIEESTAGAINISNAATLLGNTVVNAAGAVNIGRVDGKFGLNIVSGALTTLGGPIGQTTPLTSLTVHSTDGEDINANVTTSGDQTYTLPVTIAPGVSLTSTGGTVTESPAVETAPVLTPIAPTLSPIQVNQATSSAVPVSTMVGNSITDDNRVYQIAVVGQSNAAGNWQYSLDGGTTWANFGSLSVSQALLLDSNDLVQFVPLAGNTQTAAFTYRAWNQSTGTPGTLADTSNNGGDTAFSTGTDTASVTVDPAPTVVGAFVSGTAWSASYLSVLDAAGLGSSTASGQGFQLPDGSSQLAADLAWTNINQISIAFSGAVNVSSTALTLYDSDNLAVPIASFSYNSTANIATWDFSAALAAGKYVMNLAATSVTDTQATELAGQWATGASTFADGSGDGVAGEDFNFYFNVLPGDARGTGAVSNSSVLLTKLDVGSVANASDYRYDVNGQATITNSDVLLEKLQIGSNINTFASPALPPQSGSDGSQPAAAGGDASSGDFSGDGSSDSDAVTAGSTGDSDGVDSTPALAVATPIAAASLPAASVPSEVLSTDNAAGSAAADASQQANDLQVVGDAGSSAPAASLFSFDISAPAQPLPSIAPAAPAVIVSPPLVVTASIVPVDAVSGESLAAPLPAASPVTASASAVISFSAIASASVDGLPPAELSWQTAAEPAAAAVAAPEAADALALVLDGLELFAPRPGGPAASATLGSSLTASPPAGVALGVSTPVNPLAVDKVFSGQAEHPADDGRTFDRPEIEALLIASLARHRRPL